MEKIKEYTFAYNNLLIKFMQDFITRIKKTYNLDDDDMCYMFALTKDSYNQLMDKDFKGNISSGIISTLYVLTNGRFSLQEIGKNIELDENAINDELNKITQRHHQKKVDELLAKIGIATEEDLNLLIAIVDEINEINEINKIKNGIEDIVK